MKSLEDMHWTLYPNFFVILLVFLGVLSGFVCSPLCYRLKTYPNSCKKKTFKVKNSQQSSVCFFHSSTYRFRVRVKVLRPHRLNRKGSGY